MTAQSTTHNGSPWFEINSPSVDVCVESYGYTGEFRMIACTWFVCEVVKGPRQCVRTKSSASRCPWWQRWILPVQTRLMGCSTRIGVVLETWCWQLGLHSRPAGPWLWCLHWCLHAPTMLRIPPHAGVPINTPPDNASLLSWYPHVKQSTSNFGFTTPRGPLHSHCLIVRVFIR
jgi:hypothetical protein